MTSSAIRSSGCQSVHIELHLGLRCFLGLMIRV